MHVTRTVNVMQSKSYFSTIYACTLFVFTVSVQSKYFFTINTFLKSGAVFFTLLYIRREVMTSLIMYERGNFRSYIVCNISQCHLLGEHYLKSFIMYNTV